MDDFIYVNETALSEEVCEQIIEKFEADERKALGLVGNSDNSSRIVKNSLKTSVDLYITDLEDWKDLDDIISKSVSENIQNYIDHCFEIFNKLDPTPNPFYNAKFDDHGYNVKAYEPGGYFHWHDDFVMDRESPRMIAMLFYLNDVDGGETEFISGKKIIPSTGKLVMFPSSWNFIHRGVTPNKGKKYIISAYLHQ